MSHRPEPSTALSPLSLQGSTRKIDVVSLTTATGSRSEVHSLKSQVRRSLLYAAGEICIHAPIARCLAGASQCNMCPETCHVAMHCGWLDLPAYTADSRHLDDVEFPPIPGLWACNASHVCSLPSRADDTPQGRIRLPFLLTGA